MFPIVLHWGAGWHTSLVIPNRGLAVGEYFQDFPYVEVNWGDQGFYQAGSSRWRQQLAAPKALLIPSASVLYFVGIPGNKRQWCTRYNRSIGSGQSGSTTTASRRSGRQTQTDICSGMKVSYEDLLRYYDGIQIWIDEQDLHAIISKINEALKVDSDGNFVDLGNAYLFDSEYSTAGRFFESKLYYYGLVYTCNTWTAEVLGQIDLLEAIRGRYIYTSQAIFDFMQEISSTKSCVNAFET